MQVPSPGPRDSRGRPEALVFGRLCADLYPLQLETRLEDVRTFERFVGGFAGNVSTGLARLGVRAAIVSAVGDDGHGRYVRRFLQDEGVDVRWLATHPWLRTALAFCEAWPPDHFPVTLYRTPTCPDWELRLEDIPLAEAASAALVYTSGMALAKEPSRSSTLAVLECRAAQAPGTRNGRNGASVTATIFDLDWRPMAWNNAADFRVQARLAVRLADTVIGGASEFEAAGLRPEDALTLGARWVVVKQGADGVMLLSAGETHRVPGLPVPVTNGLGAGDAFAAAYGAGLLSGLPPLEAIRRGNAAGAIVATRLSCSAACPTPGEIEALLAGAPIVDGVVQGVCRN